MKALLFLVIFVAVFAAAYNTGANRTFPQLDPIMGVTRATPAPIPLAMAATPAPRGTWMYNHKTELDKPAHNQTGGVVYGGWGNYVPQ